MYGLSEIFNKVFDPNGNLKVSLQFPLVNMPQAIYQYPYCGNTRGYAIDADNPQAQHYMLYLPGGTGGVVRSFWTLLPALGGWTDMLHPDLGQGVDIAIWADCGDVPLAQLSALDPAAQRMKLWHLLGGLFDEVGPTEANPRVNRAYDLYFDGTSCALHWKLPIPFSNGILIQVIQNGAPIQVGCSWVHCEAGGMPNWEYKDWRLKFNTLWDTNITYNDPNPPATVTFLDIADGPGMIAGIFSNGNAETGAMPTWMENNWQFKIDGSPTVNWQTSGFEDLFGISPFYYQSGVQLHEYLGCTYRPAGTNKVASYRIFAERDPLIWTDGIQGLWTYGPQGDGTAELSVVTAYYAP